MTATPTRSTEAKRVLDDLEERGYAVVEGLLSRDEAAAKRAELTAVLDRTPTGRNEFEGYNTRRVYALFAKTRVFDEAATHPLVQEVAETLLGPHQLSAPTGIEIGPGEPAQILHRDDSIYPLTEPHPEVVLNTMWALDDFTKSNGATRIVPGSHQWETGRWPGEADEVIQAEMPAGSVIFYVGHLFHGGGANQTDRPRLGVILEYAASWLRAQETHLLAVPQELARTLPERLQELLGYNIYPPFVGYVDGRHPRRVLEQ
ncbi:MAG TPA: phytanoyl-CoA dioxygenase family protein [Acidimicrobiales bacterium]|nr:phytanoyl-CoA dioxygenase family protein [Acidimicrobiales bacterium]